MTKKGFFNKNYIVVDFIQRKIIYFQNYGEERNIELNIRIRIKNLVD